jgi:hypothetical protein
MMKLMRTPEQFDMILRGKGKLVGVDQLINDSLKQYLQPIAVFHISNAKKDQARESWDLRELLRSTKNLLKKDDVRYLLGQLGGEFQKLSTLNEYKRQVKEIIVDACFGDAQALEALREKEENAGRDKVVSFKDVFGPRISNLSALKTELPLDIGIAAIHADSESGIDWTLLTEWVDHCGDDETKVAAGFYAIVQDRLRYVGKRDQLQSIQHVETALESRKRGRGSGSDSEGAKRTKFSTLSADGPASVQVQDPTTEHGKALWNMLKTVAASGVDTQKYQYIKHTICRRESKASSPHDLMTGLSKEMRDFIAMSLVPAAPVSVEDAPEEEPAEAEDKTAEEEPSSEEETTSSEEEEPSSAEEEQVDFADYDDVELEGLEDILVPTNA